MSQARLAPEDVKHGVRNGFEWERRHGVEHCRPCTDANNAYQKAMRARYRERIRRAGRLKHKAFRVLAARHRAEYHAIVKELRAEVSA